MLIFLKKHSKKGLNYILIIVFMILGFIGLALPVVPQAIFFAIALILISFEIPALEKYIENRVDKNSSIGVAYYSVKEKVEKYLKF